MEYAVVDLQTNGLREFSLRRVARAAGTTHKVLLYHFADANSLMGEALHTLRTRRIDVAVAAYSGNASASLVERFDEIWAAITSVREFDVLEQATALAVLDPEHFGNLGSDATSQYLPALLRACPTAWDEEKKTAAGTLILGVMRGLLVDRMGTDDSARVSAAVMLFRDLLAALESTPDRPREDASQESRIV